MTYRTEADSAEKVKYLAFYLPQFHAIKENDEWWGKGFTEWTNTRPAQSFFDGHYQPHVPHEDVGYYDLTDENVMVRQAEMAQKYGIHGFCYYYYWFNGRRLMEMPLENMLRNKKVDIPFCLFWANHNWTRSWDAGNSEILLEQTYDEGSYRRFIDDLVPYFNDERYIRIDGKPLLMIYQCNHMPNPAHAVDVWRSHAREQYGLELYLVTVQQNNMIPPAEYGYDAALESNPNFRSARTLLPKKKRPELPSDVEITFYDYVRNALLYICRPKEAYKVFKCVYPMWDNTPRRKKKKGWMFYGATPELFRKFLVEMTRRTIEEFEPKERFLFINAWNEWAEGTHLEPDQKYGYKMLEICREVKDMPARELARQGFGKIHKAVVARQLYGTALGRFCKKWSPIQKRKEGTVRRMYVFGVLVYQYTRDESKK